MEPTGNPLPFYMETGSVCFVLFPYYFMTNFLTVKEASALTKKSPSSIRRIFYPILEAKAHPDRALVQPDPQTAKAMRLRAENFAWKISEELLKRELSKPGARPPQALKTKMTTKTADDSPAMIEILKKELDIKNEQIARQNELLQQMSTRIHEGNVLLGTLQQRFALPEASEKKDTVQMSNETSSSTTSDISEASIAQKKTGIFRWMFRS